jgi:predicted MPP superfamily phosphohydrolase
MQLASGWRLREFDLELLPASSMPLRILHLSDLHIAPNQLDKTAWVRSLAGLKPDLVINTGDNLSDIAAVPLAIAALEPLFEFAGAFVWGSNDYFAPQPRNPLRYLIGPSKTPSKPRRSIELQPLADRFAKAGWLDLNNQSGALRVGDTSIGLLGLNDPHEGLADFESLSKQADQVGSAELVIGVAHAPYLRVIESFARQGAKLVLAGHTHGGQVCLPGGRALVSNCDLPPKFARGLSGWSFEGHDTMLHVSAGLGTSQFAQYRLFCPPEASLITLRPKAS